MIWPRVFRIFLGFFCVFFVGVLRIWLCFGNDISFYVIVRIEKKKNLNVVFQGNRITHFWIWFKDGILELWFTFEANALLKYCLLSLLGVDYFTEILCWNWSHYKKIFINLIDSSMSLLWRSARSTVLKFFTVVFHIVSNDIHFLYLWIF